MGHMGKAVISIPNVTWRDGKPRFIPGPELRAAGYKGKNLRHPPEDRHGRPVGPWFTLEECIAWSDALAEEWKQRPASTKPRVNRSEYMIANLIEDWLRDPRLNGKELREGKKVRRPLKASTVRGYRKSSNIIRLFDGGYLWTQPAAALSPKALAGILDRIEQNHGLAQVRAVRAAISSAYSWGVGKNKVLANPVKAMELRLPTNPPRVRYGQIEEMQTLIAAADAIGLPEMGDSYMLGLFTGTRQNDRLALTGGQITPDGVLIRQSKKHGEPLLIPAAPDLERRLRSATKRRAGWRINYPHIILDEKPGIRRPFDPEGSHYRRLHRKVRDAAVAGVKDAAGNWVVKPCPSLQDFRDQDLRDTAVTWLALAGNGVIDIASITGHTLESASTILRHYLGMHPDMARGAIGKLVTWLDDNKLG